MRYSKSGSSDIASKIRHHTPLAAPAAETPKDAVPVAKQLRQVTPRRTRPHNPEHALDKHPVVAPGRTLLVWPTNDQRAIRSQAASLKTKRSITPKTASKSSLESRLSSWGNP